MLLRNYMVYQTSMQVRHFRLLKGRLKVLVNFMDQTLYVSTGIFRFGYVCKHIQCCGYGHADGFCTLSLAERILK